MKIEIVKDEMLEYRSVQGDSHHTIERLESTIRLFIRWLKDTEDVDDTDEMTIEMLEGYKSYLSNAVSRRGGLLKPSTVNARIKGVRVLLDYGYTHRLMRSDLSAILEYIREPSPLPQVLTHEQVLSFLDVIDTDSLTGIRNRAIVELLYSSGIRITETVLLEIDDVNFERGEALVFGKGRKERKVPVGSKALKSIDHYLNAGRPFLIEGGDSRRLFIGRGGTPLCASSFRQALRGYAKNAGIKKAVTPHMFRRSCTSEMVRGNANLYAVKDILGHESLNTLKHYCRLHIDDLKKALKECHPREQDDF